MPWLPKPTLLRTLRERMELSIERLAADAGVDEKTIRNIESGRTKVARAATLKAIAAVLDVEIAEFATHAEPPQPRWGQKGSSRQLGETLPPPSRLDSLVALERAIGRVPATKRVGQYGVLEELTAGHLQNIVTAYLVHEGDRFWVTGRVMRQHGISDEEADALGAPSGVGARFLVTKDVANDESLNITVYSSSPEHTRLLQQQLASSAPVDLVVRVIVAAAEKSRATDGCESRRWKRFALFGSRTLHPWTMLVDELI